MFRKEGLSGAIVFRGIARFGKKSVLQAASIIRLSTDLSSVIEVVDTREKVKRIKPIIDESVKEGLVTEEKARVFPYEG